MKLDNKNKIAYLAHPTAAEEVKKARELGFEIIDIRFAPEGLDSGKDGKSGKDGAAAA